MNEIGIKQVAERIHTRLQRYLEAQYHIKNPGFIEERRKLLFEPGSISQRPYVEVTPSYAVCDGFTSLNVPDAVKNLLTELAALKPSIGVFPPYKHQADALEAYFRRGNDGSDLIVATGTGSGKTETFLYSILGALAMEATTRPASFARNGVRALLLYPMNALVSDQTARLRRLFGDTRLSGTFSKRWGRHPRFGMYTSRTPYPGIRTSDKDGKNIATLLEYFVRLEESATPEDRELVKELRDRGRWPSKDLIGFLAEAEEETRTYQKGKKAGKTFTKHHWDKRLFTQPGDRELLTRHEMQAIAPDLLVTNYSMLEYMLLRPIERSIFARTREWLASDPKNQLLLILDEAHMYRGVAGAEVGLLVRRLQSRLGISRERMRCILTSASLGTGKDAEEAGKVFGAGLTGTRSTPSFEIVRGTREARTGSKVGTVEEAAAFALVDPTIFAGVDLDAIKASVAKLASTLGWTAPEGNLPQYVAKQLTGTGPLELLIESCAGNAAAFEGLASILFPTAASELAEKATDGLLALGCFARRFEPGRQEQPLLPTRVHMLFRGLPSVHACLNPKCNDRRQTPGDELLLGRLYTEPRTHCSCGSRVFEIFTHRDCGAAFLRGFGTERTAQFLWNEKGGKLTEFGKPLHEIHFLLEQPHPDQEGDVELIWLDTATGRIFSAPPKDESGFRVLYRPLDGEEALSTFDNCPVCTRRTKTRGNLKIMDLATKGEQPFANLIREQFVNQVATKPHDERHPNAGRKALLFSDGRQKAARLARDLPREVERDSLREALIAAIAELSKVAKESVVDETLYAAFVSVCARYHLHFFDDQEQKTLLEECQRFTTDYDSDLVLALDEGWRPSPPVRYRRALLRQISDPYYSLVAACAVSVEPRRPKMKLLERRIGGAVSPEVLEQITAAWIREMLDNNAFDQNLPLVAREQEFPFFDAVRAEDGMKKFFENVRVRASLDSDVIARLRAELFEVFTRAFVGTDDSGRLLSTDCLLLRIAIDDTWMQCGDCGNVQLKPFFDGCENCGAKNLEPRPPDHPYMTARKGFFREPLRAVLGGQRPVHITAEEHTAQLSQRDAGVVYATTEQFELRFQDVPLGKDMPPVDVLSCTTTMEVGIDIGSLTAVGLRTVPPLRENYQQRAGRAGRRGTSVSSVLTFAQGGAHDAHYFEHPETMISGPAREPRIKSDNKRLAIRHVYSYLLQTFFHGQMDRLSPDEQAALAAGRPGLMSAFGNALDFFADDELFSFDVFREWAQGLEKSGTVLNDVVSWLPDELVESAKDKKKEKLTFVRGLVTSLVSELEAVGKELEVRRDDNEEEPNDPGSLLDLLFDKGLLPSYAFPTDLCSFVIQDYDNHRIVLKERPQLAKAQALSEYAPGRLLVVNKQTYRVGGIFFDTAPTASPAVGVFAGERDRYIGCRRCSFVRLDRTTDVERPLDDAKCPVCKEELSVNELLDPPAFSPERGRRLEESDRDQDITFASSAQLPEIVNRDFNWNSVHGARIGYAYAEGVKLIVTNKGDDNSGFAVCETCGAAWLSDDEIPDKGHARPFLVPRYVMMREQAPRQCTGTIRKGIFLGHEFRTDILLLRIEFQGGMDFSPEQPWLYDALSTCAEAMALGASLGLSIDPGELSSGFRLVPPTDDAVGAAEIYLFDTASGGAGYAYEVGLHLNEMLDHVEKLLTTCPGGCERSCTKCLRHYGNRFLHPRLDRRLGLQLLRYARRGEEPEIAAVEAERKTLEPLARFLELEGWARKKSGAPLLLVPPPGGPGISIGTYPALLSKNAALSRHFLSENSGGKTLLLPDYLVEQDLPSAYQEVAKASV
jgi:ATP-dependent helicase YprA (DUF1998 family)